MSNTRRTPMEERAAMWCYGLLTGATFALWSMAVQLIGVPAVTVLDMEALTYLEPPLYPTRLTTFSEVPSTRV